jgi:hypothetical protein
MFFLSSTVNLHVALEPIFFQLIFILINPGWLGRCFSFVLFTSPLSGLVVVPSGLGFITADGLLAVHRRDCSPSTTGTARHAVLELVLPRLRLAPLRPPSRRSNRYRHRDHISIDELPPPSSGLVRSILVCSSIYFFPGSA